MINTLIAAIVALFFWGKSSKELEEKTQLASWLRTCVYGVLAFMVLVFYVKTYQVAIVDHFIQVNGIKETVDANGEVADTIATIDLTNKFSSNITENYFVNKTGHSEEDTSIRRISECGGLYMALVLHNGPAYNIRINPQVEKIGNEINKMQGYESKIVFGDYPLDTYSHAYMLNYITSYIPSLIPFFPTYCIEDTARLEESGGMYRRTKLCDCDSYGEGLTSSISLNGVDNQRHEVSNQGLLREMYVGNIIICDTITQWEDYHYKYLFDNNFLQKMNFFTAADVSQYTCNVSLESDCYIERMNFMYDLPIEITHLDSCMEMTSYSFVVKGDLLNKKIANHGNYRFHVKFPTLANLQLIRSLILTTILTALMSLFFLNLFYLVRKYLIKFKEKHISQFCEERAKRYRRIMCILAIAIMVFFVYVTLRIYNEQPFHIKIEIYDWLSAYYIWVILTVLALLCVLLYFLFRKAYITTVPKKRGEAKIKEKARKVENK